MESNKLASLKLDALRQATANKLRLRNHYRLAKDLGFSAAEAKLLQGRSESYIRTLAQELEKPDA